VQRQQRAGALQPSNGSGAQRSECMAAQHNVA
jgi:hypothetical protein